MSFFTILFLAPSIPRSFFEQAQSYISGVNQIFQAHMDSTDRHKSWAFWSAHAGFFRVLVVRRKSSVDPMHKIPVFYLQFHAKSLSLTFVNLCVYRLSHSVSLCLSHWSSSVCVNTNVSSNPPICEQCALTAWEVTDFQRNRHPTSPHQSCQPHCVLILSPYSFFHTTDWLACRHDNNRSLWQQPSKQLDSWAFGHVVLLQASPRSLDGRTVNDNQYFLLNQKGPKPAHIPFADIIHFPY